MAKQLLEVRSKEGAMPICPVCEQPMSVSAVVSVAGIENKPVSWCCERDGVEAGAVHPVQISHLRVGTEEEREGRRTRIIGLAMQGAELLVFRRVLSAADTTLGQDG